MADEVKKAKLELVTEEEFDEEEREFRALRRDLDSAVAAAPETEQTRTVAVAVDAEAAAAGAAMSDPPNFDPIKVGGDVVLAQHAEVIRALGKRVVHDVIEIGRRLTDAKARCGHWQLAAVAGARVRMER